MKLRKIGEQVMVITGATSGIGLTTARMAAEKGAQLMLIARNADALEELCNEINGKGGRAIHHAADVADESSLREAASRAVAELGRIDTWVNNAGVAIYGKLTEVSDDDSRRLFETNFWGIVAGSRVAVEHLREKGGALINLGSEVSDTVVPLLGMYCASKHAVKGFTDGLRMELEADGVPISVTLIKPTAIHTPFSENAKNYLEFEPQVPQPIYAPELVAEAIINCAQYPARDFFVGEMAAVHSAMATYTPRMNDKFMEMTAESAQDSGKPSEPGRTDGLHSTNSDLRERASTDRFVMETSVYHKAKLHPFIAAGLVAGGGIALATLLGKRFSKSDGYDRRALDAADRRMAGARSSEIAEHMEVIGSDGEHIGTVDHIKGDQILLTRSDSAAGGRHHLIALTAVGSVEQNKVTLNKTAGDVMTDWRPE